MLLPHELFSATYHQYAEMWRKIVYGGEQTCKKFWADVSGSEHFRTHPVRQREISPRSAYLGDGTPVTGL